jgi:hypothetical protein
MAMLQVLLNQVKGPLPLKGTFQCRSSDIIDAIVTGVSYRKTGTPNGPAGVNLVITDSTGNTIGEATGRVEGSAVGGWRSMISQWGQMKLNAGETYNFEVRAAFPEVDSSSDNFFTATLVY